MDPVCVAREDGRGGRMCLTRRLGRRSGDLGGDTGAPPSPRLRWADERRRGRRSDTPHRAKRSKLAGNRYAALLTASDEDPSDEDEDADPTSRPSQISLGCFFLGPGLREPSSPANLPSESSGPLASATAPTGGRPPPPSTAPGSMDFPPLPSRGERGSSPLVRAPPHEIRIGSLSVTLSDG
jgi:hypothetical protein